MATKQKKATTNQATTKTVLTANEAAQTVAGLQIAKRPRRHTELPQTGSDSIAIPRSSNSTKSDTKFDDVTQAYRIADEERFRRIESDLTSKVKIDFSDAKSELKEEISKHKQNLLLWGIGIFIPTLIAIIIYHFTTLQTFKSEVKESIDNTIIKHKLNDLENRQNENQKNSTKNEMPPNKNKR